MTSTEPGDGAPVDDPTPDGVVAPEGAAFEERAVALVEAEDEDGLFPAPVSPAPHTGDAALDAALAGLEDAARSGDPEAQVVAGERVHRELQQRLTHLEGPGAG